MRNETYKDDPKRIQMLKDAVKDLRMAHSAIQFYQTDLSNNDVNNLRDMYSALLAAQSASEWFISEYEKKPFKEKI